jgi:DNA repair protein RadC
VATSRGASASAAALQQPDMDTIGGVLRRSGRSPEGPPSRGDRSSRPTDVRDDDGVRSVPSPVCDRCRREVAFPTLDGVRLSDPDEVAGFLVPLIGGADREHCLAVELDTKHRVLRVATVSIGSIDHTFMTPHGIFREAVMGNAAAVILAHNHPSGDPEPSRDDERVTRRLVEAGRLLGVEVLDHLVVGGGSWVSLARRGLV